MKSEEFLSLVVVFVFFFLFGQDPRANYNEVVSLFIYFFAWRVIWRIGLKIVSDWLKERSK